MIAPVRRARTRRGDDRGRLHRVELGLLAGAGQLPQGMLQAPLQVTRAGLDDGAQGRVQTVSDVLVRAPPVELEQDARTGDHPRTVDAFGEGLENKLPLIVGQTKRRNRHFGRAL